MAAAPRSSGSYNINQLTATTGKLKVKWAATVVCARLRPKPVQVLRLFDVKRGAEGEATDDRVGHLFGHAAASSSSNGDKSELLDTTQHTTFTSGWELLMGQGEVQNYLRSSEAAAKVMRHGGEYKFAGGSVDAGESLEAAARRELEEEFLTPVPADAKLRLFDVKQTRPVRLVSLPPCVCLLCLPLKLTLLLLPLLLLLLLLQVQNTSYIMHNFICLEEENPWLAELDTDSINTELAARRERFGGMAAIPGGEFWSLPTLEEKEAVSPEVRSVEWLDMRAAVSHCFTSMNSEMTFVNDFQVH